MTRSVRHAASRHAPVRAAVAFGAAAALFFVGLMTPGAEAAGPFPFSQVSEIRFVTTALCNLGTLGTSIGAGDTATHATPRFINVSDVERCVSARTLNAPNPLNPENADIRIESELFNYSTVATGTGYGTRLMVSISRFQGVPFAMSVATTAGAMTSGDVVINSEVFTYNQNAGTCGGGFNSPTQFCITARAQRGSQAADHSGGDTNVNQARVYATGASGKTSSIQTALSTAISQGQSMPFNIDVGTTANAESSCASPPCVLLIDDERFTYTVVDTNTFQLTGRAVNKTSAAMHSMNAQVFAPRDPPFELEVGDARTETGFDADSLSNAATGTVHHICLGSETLEYNPSATETVGDGLGGGADVIYVTARGLDRVVAPFECGLITPRAVEGQPHAGTTIRDATRVQLLGRAMPEYDGGTATMAAPHSGVAIVTPPEFNRCISRSERTEQGGPDGVVSRTRCYSRVLTQPSPPGSEDGSGPYFVSTNAQTDPFTFISESNGTFNDETDGVIVTILDVFLLGQCISVGSLHVEVRSTINVDKTGGDTDYGSFNIRVFLNSDTCSGTPNYIIGACDNLALPAPQTATGACATAADGTNFSATPLAVNSDIDKDGCADYRELGPVASPNGGQRDPFNPFDFTDINHDGSISAGVDVLGVAQAFGGATGARYVDYKDRGVILGPFAWNKAGPNNNVNAGEDVLGTAQQFGHTCPHTHASTTYFGAHPTTLYAPIAFGAAAPFPITLGTAAGFPASGMVLIDAETLTYDLTSCGSITATQLCVTARGNGIPAGNVAAAHNGNVMGSGAVVYPKP